MVKLRQVTPLLHVPDIDRALDFFTRVLRFEITFRAADYAYLTWESVALRILEEPQRVPAVPGHARVTVYIDVVDVDALYAELLPKLEALPSGEVHPPNDQSWGQRELQVRMTDGHWLAFGQPVRGGRPEE